MRPSRRCSGVSYRIPGTLLRFEGEHAGLHTSIKPVDTTGQHPKVPHHAS